MIVGYSDPFVSLPGDQIDVMVSCTAPTYTARVVRMIHGDLDPRGPGLRYEEVEAGLGDRRVFKGREQDIPRGSLVAVDAERLRALASFTIALTIMPTHLPGRPQGLATCWSGNTAAGYGLFLGESGALELWIGDGAGSVVRVETGRPLTLGRWHVVAAAYDAASGSATLVQRPLRAWPSPSSESLLIERGSAPAPQAPEAPTAFVLAGTRSKSVAPDLCFNGKIERPIVVDRALDEAALATLEPGGALPDGTIAAWDLTLGDDPRVVHDDGPYGLHGRTDNGPTRAVTSSGWTGREVDFRRAPAEYAAIHFHDDDLDDARWEPDFAVRLPPDARGGIYAVHVEGDGEDDWVPFLVSTARDQRRADVALVLPTLSYLAYANEHLIHEPERETRGGFSHTDFLPSATDYERRLFQYIVAQRLHSTYDRHADGTGVCYASSRRPIVNVRPSYNKPSQHFRIPHQLGADLYLVDWLERKGIAYDVLTDHDLHYDGIDALRPYRAIVTGTHPEYTSEPMLDAIEGYLDGGGRLMYLGGNGFYWVTSVDPSARHVIEVRRGETGTRTWQALPGENHCSTTGELGGIWRSRGRPPQRLFGVGFTAQGTDAGRGYRRSPDSENPRVAFVFEGVDDDVIGDFGLYLDAAAGWEIDRVEHDLGTPAHTVVLATATGFSDTYQHAIEEVLDGTSATEGGPHSPLVRADLVYLEYPKGGAVFSVGSITWAGSLSHADYDNNVSRTTENVLRAFASATFPQEAAR